MEQRAPLVASSGSAHQDHVIVLYIDGSHGSARTSLFCSGDSLMFTIIMHMYRDAGAIYHVCFVELFSSVCLYQYTSSLIIYFALEIIFHDFVSVAVCLSSCITCAYLFFIRRVDSTFAHTVTCAFLLPIEHHFV